MLDHKQFGLFLILFCLRQFGFHGESFDLRLDESFDFLSAAGFGFGAQLFVGRRAEPFLQHCLMQAGTPIDSSQQAWGTSHDGPGLQFVLLPA